MLDDKYEVKKTDGTPVDPEAKYFVLRLDPIENEQERFALSYYVLAIADTDLDLAKRILTELLALTINDWEREKIQEYLELITKNNGLPKIEEENVRR